MHQKPLDFYRQQFLTPSYPTARSLCVSSPPSRVLEQVSCKQKVVGRKNKPKTHKAKPFEQNKVRFCSVSICLFNHSHLSSSWHNMMWGGFLRNQWAIHRCLLHQPISFYMGKYNLDIRSCFLTTYISSPCAYAIQHSQSYARLK